MPGQAFDWLAATKLKSARSASAAIQRVYQPEVSLKVDLGAAHRGNPSAEPARADILKQGALCGSSVRSITRQVEEVPQQAVSGLVPSVIPFRVELDAEDDPIETLDCLDRRSRRVCSG